MKQHYIVECFTEFEMIDMKQESKNNASGRAWIQNGVGLVNGGRPNAMEHHSEEEE